MYGVVLDIACRFSHVMSIFVGQLVVKILKTVDN